MHRKPLPEWKRWRWKPVCLNTRPYRMGDFEIRHFSTKCDLDNGNICSYNKHAVDVDGK